MLGQISKLVARIGQVTRVCGPFVGARYAAAIVATLPQVLKRRDLQPADKSMSGVFRVRFRGRDVLVPCTETDRVNTIADDGPTFAGIREIFSDEVYLRGFRQIGAIDTFVDLGANRGMVSLMAAQGLGARMVVGVEPQAPYGACFAVLAKANGLSTEQSIREVKFAGAHDDETTISVNGVRQAYGIDHIDFFKCDIEGAENTVVLEDDSFLAHVSLISMELHPEADTRTLEIVERMTNYGFHVSLADAEGESAPAEVASYLYASRKSGDLTLPATGPGG